MTAETVVATQLNHHIVRFKFFQQQWQSRQSIAGGITADTGIDNPVLRFQVGPQQVDPAIIGVNAIAGAQAIPQHQQGGCSAIGGEQK